MLSLYQDGETALYVATKNNHADIALLLIEAGCSVDIKNNVSSYSLQYQLTKPLMIVVHMFTYLQCSELASPQPMGHVSPTYQQADWNMCNVEEQAYPMTAAVD